MERWRWLPSDLGSFYVMVNVPEFMLRVMANGDRAFTARVVVGKPDTQTPIFSNNMQEVVFNPYWNLPNSIKTAEVLPATKARRGWFFGGGASTLVFKRQNLRVAVGGREVDPEKLDWSSIDIRTLDIYQPPGPGNVLGKVKFMFPNKHDVYIHDTPMKFLFDESARAESHGCVRVENPDQFALMLLRRDQGWTAANVDSAFRRGDDQHVALKRKIAVHRTYFTLRVNDDSSISTFGDLYGHDAGMAAALYGESIAFSPPSGTDAADVRRTQDLNRARRSPETSNIADSVSGFLSNF
jgi:murein L,D-transpeptidase YcbB/YkuD